ncbi:hypothetical protein [Nocardia albiluteola]|uniref:hypothetical protein n=1 Tax=Nocardia albiluteola TaxID=2842303 RepID=UPI001FD93521|nr:hypothetical protein [Nocardia albiluteola]
MLYETCARAEELLQEVNVMTRAVAEQSSPLLRPGHAFSAWLIDTLPGLGSRVVDGSLSACSFTDLANRALALLPPAADNDVRSARRLIVELGIVGSSVASYSQRENLDLARRDPGCSLARLRVGEAGIPFRAYFNTLVARSGTGHPNRDAYASLILWNAPEMSAYRGSSRICTLPSVFDDGRIRTYTAEIGETLIIELFKRCETLEAAANIAVQPIWADGAFTMSRDEIAERFATARLMLAGVRRLFLNFSRGDERGALSVAHFIDVFRQYAVHWDHGDVAPSGPQDVQFILRDLMTGIDMPGYVDHVERILAALLADERQMVTDAAAQPSLPEVLLNEAGLSPQQLAALPDSELTAVLRRYPVLGECYLLLELNARLSAAHLMVAKKYLYKPNHQRDQAGAAVAAPVPNDKGITELPESALDMLNRARRRHLLSAIGRWRTAEVAAICGATVQRDISINDTLALFMPRPDRLHSSPTTLTHLIPRKTLTASVVDGSGAAPCRR